MGLPLRLRTFTTKRWLSTLLPCLCVGLMVVASSCSKPKPVPVLSARLVVPVRNFESTRTCAGGATGELQPTEAVVHLPAQVELALPHSGTLSISAEGTVLDSRLVDAGLSLIAIPPAARPGVRRVTIGLSGKPGLRLEYDVSTVAIDGSGFPPGHSFVSDVDLATGQVSSGHQDLTLPWIDLSRTFRVNSLTSSSLGQGWMHNQEMFVIRDGNATLGPDVRRYLLVSHSGGQVFTCRNGRCEPQRGFHGTFREEEGSLVFRAKAGQAYRFAPVQSSFPTQYYRYEGAVTPLKEETSLAYEDPANPTRLTRITGPGGSAVRFLYSGTRLARVEVGETEVSKCIDYVHRGDELVGVRRFGGPCGDGGTLLTEETYAYSEGRLSLAPGEGDGGAISYEYFDAEEHLAEEDCYGLATPMHDRVRKVASDGDATTFEYGLVSDWRTILGTPLLTWTTQLTHLEPGTRPLKTTYWLDAYGAVVMRETNERVPHRLTQRWNPTHIALEERSVDDEVERFAYDDFGNMIRRRRTVLRGRRAVDAGPGTVERWAHDPAFSTPICQLAVDGRLTFYGVDSNGADPRDGGVVGTGVTLSRIRYANPYKAASGETCLDALEAVDRSPADEFVIYRYCGVDGVRCKSTAAFGTYAGNETGRRDEFDE